MWELYLCYIGLNDSVTYRQLKETDGDAAVAGRSVSYSSGCSTTSLRKHIGQYHAEEYVAACKMHGWKVQIGDPDSSSSSDPKIKRPPFSLDGFVKRLVKFIVADDQVSDKYP